MPQIVLAIDVTLPRVLPEPPLPSRPALCPGLALASCLRSCVTVDAFDQPETLQDTRLNLQNS